MDFAPAPFSFNGGQATHSGSSVSTEPQKKRCTLPFQTFLRNRYGLLGTETSTGGSPWKPPLALWVV